MNFTGTQVKVNTLQGMHTLEVLLNALHLQNRFGHSLITFLKKRIHGTASAYCTKAKRFVCFISPKTNAYSCTITENLRTVPLFLVYYNKLYQKNQDVFSFFVLTAQISFYII